MTYGRNFGLRIGRVLLAVTAVPLLAAAADPQSFRETGWHKVAAGETFIGIARSFGMEPVALLKLNPGIRPNRLAKGARVRVPCSPVLKPGTRKVGEVRAHVPAPDQELRANVPGSSPAPRPSSASARPEGCPDI